MIQLFRYMVGILIPGSMTKKIIIAHICISAEQSEANSSDAVDQSQARPCVNEAPLVNVIARSLNDMVLVPSHAPANLLFIPLASSPGRFWVRRSPIRLSRRNNGNHNPRKRYQPFKTRAGPSGHDQAEELKCFKVFVEKQDLPIKAMIQSVVCWRGL